MPDLKIDNFNQAQPYFTVTDGNNNGIVDSADRVIVKTDFLDYKKNQNISYDNDDFNIVLNMLSTQQDNPLYQFFPIATKIVESFPYYIDYDIDPLNGTDDGCHGTDLVFNGDQLRVDFTLLEGGAVLVRLYDDFPTQYIYRLDPNDQIFNQWLIFSKPITVRYVKLEANINHVNIMESLFYFTDGMIITDKISSCATESQNLNPNLTSAQMQIVQRFFDAAAKLYTSQFGSQ